MRGLAIMALLAGSWTAYGNILTFDGDICSGSVDGTGPMTICPNGSRINQAYGDTADVNVTYQAGPGPTVMSMQKWNETGVYSNLTNVAYGDFGALTASITLAPLGGKRVTLNSFLMGTDPPSVPRNATVEVWDLATNTLVFTTTFSNGGGNPVGAAGVTVNPGVSSLVGLRLSYGPDVFNVAVDSVDFSLTVDANSGVPEPGTWSLVLAGITVAWRRLRAGKANPARS